MLTASREHLAQAGESYFEHMRFAMIVGALAVGAGLACIVHAVVPALCPRSCRRTVGQLQTLFADRHKLGQVSAASSGVLIFVVLMLVSSVTALATAIAVGDGLMALLVIAQAYALPLIYLTQNPGLDPVQQVPAPVSAHRP
jgi:hypothetical protein